MTYPHEKTPTNTIKPKVATVIPVIKEKTEQQLELERIISAQLTERLFAPVTFEGIEKSVAYVTAANGLFKVTKTPIGLFKEQLEEFKTEVIGLPKMEIGVELAIPKIPMRKLIEALSYYRDINTKDRTEASVLFFWNHNNLPLPEIPGLSAEGQLVTYCPTQVNSAALSDFTMDLNVAWMRTNLALLLETHSHNTMNAFFSGTDNANENMTQFYGVWGKVTDGHPAFSFRYVVGKSKIECDPSVLIDWPKMTTETVTKKHNRVTLSGDFSLLDIDLPEGTNGNSVSVDQDEVETTSSFESLVPGPFAMVEYPADWMAQHSTSKFRYSSPSYVYGKTAGAGAGAKNYGRNVETEDWDDWGKDYGYDKREAGQGSLLGEYYRNRFGWKEEEDKVGTEAKKFGAAANAANENEPYLTTEDGSEDLDTAFEESIVVSSEKGELSRELNALAVEIAKEVVLDGNSVIYF